MITKRIIPCLDVAEGRVVKGTQFVNLRDAGDPVELAQFYYDEGADEICFLDITASHEERKATYEIIEKTAQKVFIPLTVGGGVNNVEDVRRLLNAGADKVAMNSGAVRNPDLIKDAAEKFGSQCVVVAVDAKSQPEKSHLLRYANPSKSSLTAQSTPVPQDSQALHLGAFQTGSNNLSEKSHQKKWNVYTRGGRHDTGLNALEWIKQAYELGAGEILLTSMDCDGSKAGYDLDLTGLVAKSVNIPVIASGGAGNTQHINDAFKVGADAALLASLLHYKELSVAEIKAAMQEADIPVRLV